MSRINARLVEKDILEDIGSTSAGDSEVIDLNGANKFSCQAVYDVVTPAAKTFDSGGAEVDTATFDTFANSTSGDYMVVYDALGSGWAISLDKTGAAAEPTGAVWVSIPAARKDHVDIQTATTGADIAALVETAFNALASVTITAVDTVAAVAFTGDFYGSTTAPEVHNANDSGAGSITIVVTDAGVDSEVNLDGSLTIPSHSFPEGFKLRLTTTGTLPDPLALATDYFVIVVDANTIKLASSLVNALAGTEIELTDQGSDEAVNTATGVALSGASVTFRKSNDGVNWIDIAAGTAITVDGSVITEQADVSFRYFKVVKALTAGVVDLKALTLVIGDN